eukprot:7379344-Prymnesium_polylepis.1
MLVGENRASTVLRQCAARETVHSDVSGAHLALQPFGVCLKPRVVSCEVEGLGAPQHIRP